MAGTGAGRDGAAGIRASGGTGPTPGTEGAGDTGSPGSAEPRPHVRDSGRAGGRTGGRGRAGTSGAAAASYPGSRVRAGHRPPGAGGTAASGRRAAPARRGGAPPGGRVRSRSVAAIDGRAANEGPAARGTLEAAPSAGPALTQAALTGPGAFARIRQGLHGPKVSSHPRRQASQAGPAPSAGGLHPVQNRLDPSAPGAARRAARPGNPALGGVPLERRLSNPMDPAGAQTVKPPAAPAPVPRPGASCGSARRR